MSHRKIGNASLRVFSAAEAKNGFGKLLDTALREGAVAITRHDQVKAVLMSLEDYEALQPVATLDALTAEFDALFGRMQAPSARAAVSGMLALNADELASAARAGG